MNSPAARMLGVAAVAATAAGGLLLVALPLTRLALPGGLQASGALFSAGIGLAALALAEPRRPAPRWWGVLVLALVGLAPHVLDLAAAPPLQPAFLLPFRLLFLAPVAALLLAAWRPRARLGMALASASLALHGLLVTWPARGFPTGIDQMYLFNMLAAAFPLVTLGAVLAFRPQGDALPRASGIALAAGGAVVGVASMGLLRALDGLRPFEDVDTWAFAAFGLGRTALLVGLVLVAVSAHPHDGGGEGKASRADASGSEG